ncbi:mannose/fructose/N-acetylgalactosamine-specific phosphotransferase system component IIC [Streptococcus porcorum]|uniref:Mannose/fructose/N-acetylgalactosamine-specific phosphotransferase system component IIC n=1 Tax=Streptococcus porcorum TaxID=701526 RepID=A0ABV2JHE3_9STRE
MSIKSIGYAQYGLIVINFLKEALPMDGIPMKTLFTVGSLLPCVGIAILLKQIVEKAVDFIPFFVGFTLAASLGLNLVSSAVISLIFAVIFYEIASVRNMKAAAPAGVDFEDDDEEDI